MTSSEKFGALEYGFWLFLLIAIGRIAELIPGLGSLPLAKLALAIPLFIRLRNRRALPGLTRTTKPMARTGVWLGITAVVLTPFSVWPGASVAFLYQQLLVLIACVSIAYVMCHSWRAVRATLFALVLSGAVLARAALSGYGGGRAATNTMYDPNDLAYLLVTVLPLALGFLMCAQTTARRLLHAGICIALLVAVLLTQSRGGFLGLLVIAAFLVLTPIQPPGRSVTGTPRKRRVKIWVLVGLCCFSVFVWSYLPQDARTRLSTIVDLGSDYNLDPNDVTGRGQIWSRGLEASLKRPVGYGPITFAMVDWKFGGRFNAPHNSFLEVLVELGVLGLILFLRMYLLALQGLQRARSSLLSGKVLSAEQAAQTVFARLLQVSLVANAVAGFFLSMAYVPVLWTIFALCMAMMALVERDGVEKSRRVECSLT